MSRRGRPLVIAYFRVPVHVSFLLPTLRELRDRDRVDLLFGCHRPEANLLEALREDFPEKPLVTTKKVRRMEAGVFITAASSAPQGLRCGITAHVPHSPVSLHVVYPLRSFARFNALLALGPHHRREAKAMLPWCRVLDAGSPRIDTLARERGAGWGGETGTVVYAPTWGPGSSLPEWGEDVIEKLLRCEVKRVVLRPHQASWKTEPDAEALSRIRERFSQEGRFVLDDGQSNLDHAGQGDVLVSDWSGVAIEFALALRRPVLFLDVPQKVHNPQYLSYGVGPGVEREFRERLGRVVGTPGEVPTALSSLRAEPAAATARIDAAEPDLLYRPGAGHVASADAVESLAFDGTTGDLLHPESEGACE